MKNQRNQSKDTNHDLRYDAYEIQMVGEIVDPKQSNGGMYCEPIFPVDRIPDNCNEIFFSIYGHLRGQGCQVIADIPQKSSAERVKEEFDRLLDTIKLLSDAHPGKRCIWIERDTGAHETTCGELYEIITGTPKQNGMLFCPYCGGLLVEAHDEVHYQELRKDLDVEKKNEGKVA